MRHHAISGLRGEKSGAMTDRQATLSMHRNRSSRRSVHRCLVLCAVLFATAFHATPATADFRICNNTSSRVGIAIGYKDAEQWSTEGWWNLSARNCETILRGPLVARYYYVYGVDYDRSGEWAGRAFMCTRDR